MDRRQDATAVLEDRHVIAHSIALEDIEVRGQGGLVNAGRGVSVHLVQAAARAGHRQLGLPGHQG